MEVQPLERKNYFNYSLSIAPIAECLSNIVASGVLWQANQDDFLLSVPEVARYLVQNGSSITVQLFPDAKLSEVNYHLNMLPLAALVYQRNMLAFHAAAVCNENSAFLLAGNSGSGKSTLIAALIQRGWKMLADDVAVVGLDEELNPIIYPSQTSIALWPKSLDLISPNSEGLPFCDPNRKEFCIQEAVEDHPRKITGIYRLCVHNKPDVLTETVTGTNCFRTINTILYNSHVADVLCRRDYYFSVMTSLAQDVPYLNLFRPRGVWSVDLLINQVVNGSGT